jgi:hypothetical protein
MHSVLVLLFSVITVSAQQREPLVGTWILNVEKSQYPPGQAPKSETRRFDYSGDGMFLCTFDRVSARGASSFGHWLIKFDGQYYMEYSRAEGPTGSTIALKKINDHTIDVSAKRDGKVYFTGTMDLSADGKLLTWKIKTTTAEGSETSQVRVYDRQ